MSWYFALSTTVFFTLGVIAASWARAVAMDDPRGRAVLEARAQRIADAPFGEPLPAEPELDDALAAVGCHRAVRWLTTSLVLFILAALSFAACLIAAVVALF